MGLKPFLLYITMDKNREIIERDGRFYEYCAADDCWYPVPTQDQYDFQRFVIFISSIILVTWISYVIITAIN